MKADAVGRKVINIYDAEYRVYDMEGPEQPDMSYIPITYNDDGKANGCYVIRMEPGAETIFHEHAGAEDYLVLEGEVIEPDGRVFKAGDFVCFKKGTRHNTRSEKGALIVGFDWGKS